MGLKKFGSFFYLLLFFCYVAFAVVIRKLYVISKFCCTKFKSKLQNSNLSSSPNCSRQLDKKLEWPRSNCLNFVLSSDSLFVGRFIFMSRIIASSSPTSLALDKW